MADVAAHDGARAGEGGWLWRLVAGTLLLAMEFVVLAALVPTEWAAEVRAAELAALHGSLAPTTVSTVLARAADWYATLCVDSGLEAAVRNLLLPTTADARRAHGLDPLVTLPVWGWLEGRLGVIFGTLQLGLLRLAVAFAWWPLHALLAAGAVGDGLLRRRIREASFRQPSATAHHVALSGFLLLPPLLGLVLFVPLPLPALGVPAVAAVLAGLGAAAVAHARKGL
jgi:hypothetical protein